MSHHNLKVFPARYGYLKDKSMTGENRFNDRDFKIGDTVTLQEGTQEMDEFIPTGKEINACISCVDSFGCQEGYVNLSYSRLGVWIF